MELEGELEGKVANLVLCSCTPVPDTCWVRDAFLKAVGAECAEHDARGAEEGTDCPERWHHV
jgi:hypothetical protein